MKTYLSELLTDDLCNQANENHESPSKTTSISENKRLEVLLKNVNAELKIAPAEVGMQNSAPQIIKQKAKQGTQNSHLIEVSSEARLSSNEDTLTTQKSTDILATKIIKRKTEKTYRQGDFQVLFFNVGGLTVAVPLIELGGIHAVDKITPLMGKPEWFKGVMLHRENKINVVDTALWVMPEKCDTIMKESLNYQYIIMLSDSAWGLTAESLVDTVTLNQEQVKWLDSPSKRPWLAGLVKDKMCALLDVDSLIELLNEGSGIYQVDS
ncbi:MAG: chemotaxis protein CheW [Colwellia sp.]